MRPILYVFLTFVALTSRGLTQTSFPPVLLHEEGYTFGSFYPHLVEGNANVWFASFVTKDGSGHFGLHVVCSEDAGESWQTCWSRGVDHGAPAAIAADRHGSILIIYRNSGKMNFAKLTRFRFDFEKGLPYDSWTNPQPHWTTQHRLSPHTPPDGGLYSLNISFAGREAAHGMAPDGPVAMGWRIPRLLQEVIHASPSSWLLTYRIKAVGPAVLGPYSFGPIVSVLNNQHGGVSPPSFHDWEDRSLPIVGGWEIHDEHSLWLYNQAPSTQAWFDNVELVEINRPGLYSLVTDHTVDDAGSDLALNSKFCIAYDKIEDLLYVSRRDNKGNLHVTALDSTGECKQDSGALVTRDPPLGAPYHEAHYHSIHVDRFGVLHMVWAQHEFNTETDYTRKRLFYMQSRKGENERAAGNTWRRSTTAAHTIPALPASYDGVPGPGPIESYPILIDEIQQGQYDEVLMSSILSTGDCVHIIHSRNTGPTSGANHTRISPSTGQIKSVSHVSGLMIETMGVHSTLSYDEEADRLFLIGDTIWIENHTQLLEYDRANTQWSKVSDSPRWSGDFSFYSAGGPALLRGPDGNLYVGSLGTSLHLGEDDPFGPVAFSKFQIDL